MNVSNSPGTIKRFWRTPWRFQQTFQTPLDKLEPFVDVIVGALSPIQTAALTIDQWVFEPKNVLSLLSAHPVTAQLRHDCCITASGDAEAGGLLRATLSDWVDFLFVPTPKPFVIYADHDEYITFFANTKSNLNRVVLPLNESGFEVRDFVRTR